MKTYKVTRISEATTSQGKPYKKVDIISQDGDDFKFVPYWESLPGYQDIAVGSKFEATIEAKQNGQYTNYTINLANMPKKQFGGGAGMLQAKTSAIKEAQANKNESIARSQERNEIMWAKNSAAEMIAHHPSYKDLNREVIVTIWQGLVNALLNYNPDLTARNEDDVVAVHALADAYQNSMDKSDMEDEIQASDVPF